MLHSFRAWRLAGLCLTIVLAFSPATHASQKKRNDPAPSADSRAAARLISTYRAANGLGPVRADSILNRAATVQANAVAASGVLSHGDFETRMMKFGAPVAAAENLGMGPRTIPEAIQLWRDSPAHNAKMLSRDYTRIGFARAGGRVRYWALVLAR